MTADRRTAAAPRLSVVIPAYNVEDWIGLTLESIRGQSESSLEVLVVDDGSTDGTESLVEQHAAEDPRVRLLRNPGKGGAQARNFGIDMARGDFLAFADGDDVVPERAYEFMLAQADSSGNDMVIGNHITIEPQRLVSRSASLPIYDAPRVGLTLHDEPLFLRDRVCWNRIIRRETWHQLGLEFSDAKRSNDIQAMTKAYCLIPFDVISEPVYAYRRRVGSSSMTSNKLHPQSLVDHFTQELACAEHVMALQDRTLTDRYFVGILQFDVWAHGQVAVLHDEVDFEPVRELLVELVTRASRDAVRALPPHHQFVYDSIARRDWEAARIALGQQGMTMVRTLEDADARAIIHAALRTDGRAVEAAAWPIRASYCKAIIDDPYALDDAELVALHSKLVSLIALGLPKRAFTWREQQIALAPRTHAAYIRAAATRPEPVGLASLRQRARAKLQRLAGDGDGARPMSPRQALELARRIRPRHVRRVSAAAVRRVRGLFGQ